MRQEKTEIKISGPSARESPRPAKSSDSRIVMKWVPSWVELTLKGKELVTS